MIKQGDIAGIVAAPPVGKRVARVLDTLRGLGELQVVDLRGTGMLYPADHFRSIYEVRLAHLRDLGAQVDPTLVDAVEDLRSSSEDVYVVAFACQEIHLVLFLSPRDEVVAGFLHSPDKGSRGSRGSDRVGSGSGSDRRNENQ
jgi:hypothetical protein